MGVREFLFMGVQEWIMDHFVYYSEHFENQVSSEDPVHVNNKYRQNFKLLLKMFLLLTEMLADMLW